ncbi:tail fiber protein [Citromicrobium bathyomarinum]|uniref:phage tail protein n=1 Tax=Citromicrobium TaxID=72173 RepID=UPI0001DD0AC9|nr:MULTISPECIES: tail fiber protein [Citromicrobium]MAY77362.1 phage tail protein [Citromicrobium sp.]ALG61244.1 Tail collar domain protein [Citromicrobium sp. JL477]KPM12686.1 Tail collar domain protein [Citromicrobium sp. JL1351]KPM13477.1 Tail collar domain protein [Citromicrobium sp. JL31]KPM17714.1 Tail collar domain protein [Citromicrobium sp. WPS32]|tara:strand:- start:14631 stop:15041 length:411 start_codon:yes stop_codon:yes gene_type:complete
MKIGILATFAAAIGTVATTAPAQASDTPYLGEIIMVGYPFCPYGWAEANGQLLSISQNTALFSLYGTTYGGDGRTTFALPDLRGRAPIHVGDRNRLGDRRDGGPTMADRAEGRLDVPGTQTLRFCVALQGVYPSRG